MRFLMLRLLVVFTKVAQIASLAWPTVKDHDFSHRANGEENVILKQPSCLKTQLPSLLFIGEGHSGTTTLSAMMNFHEHLKFGNRKEHNFFYCDEDEEVQCPRDVDQYKSEFSVECNTKHTFDATQTYMSIAANNEKKAKGTLNHQYGKPAVEYVHSILPEAKIMVMIRDPVDSLWSEGVRDLDQMLSHDALATLVTTLKRWMEVYDPSVFLIIRAEEAFNDLQDAANQVFKFMGLQNRSFTTGEMSQLEHAGRRRTLRKPSPTLRMAYYANDNSRNSKWALERFLGQVHANGNDKWYFDWEGSQ